MSFQPGFKVISSLDYCLLEKNERVEERSTSPLTSTCGVQSPAAFLINHVFGLCLGSVLTDFTLNLAPYWPRTLHKWPPMHRGILKRCGENTKGGLRRKRAKWRKSYFSLLSTLSVSTEKLQIKGTAVVMAPGLRQAGDLVKDTASAPRTEPVSKKDVLW
ncbi:hypothetical protein WMY93_010170 [Mugilogobius chulae]|uniref:Uncharacterized protein n=1 Tax=Mugilogobius chulae TaxID=88201 RepID=A0AAW0PCC2_9GOBI